jgi:hypothetical protein
MENRVKRGRARLAGLLTYTMPTVQPAAADKGKRDMALFPPSTNDAYTGARISAWFLALSGLLELVPGCIHYFLPDGGAGVIAHLDLSHNPNMIFGLFAWMGSVQIPFGLAILIVAARYRSLVPLFLFLNMMERGLMSFAAWVFKPSLTGHHPPENYGSPIAAALLAIFLVLSLRPRKPE